MIRIIREKSLFKKFKDNISNFKLFAFLGVMTLVVGLTLYLTTKQQDIRQRAMELAPYFQNEYIRIWDSRVFPGIIDLFYLDQGNNWQQYNNIVPIARVNGVWANAELDKAFIARQIISDTPTQKVVQYQFAPLSNNAHFYLIMTLDSGKHDVQFQVKLNNDSAPVEAFALGNYYGYAQLVRYLKINSTIYNAFTYPKPDPDGNYILGRFTRYEFPTNNRVDFWGSSGLKQYQFVDVPLSLQDEMVSEVRYTPWLPTQTPPGQNWFETVHITRSPFDDSRSIWHFGYDLPTMPPAPTTIPTLTPSPSPTPSPTPITTGTLNVTTNPYTNASIKIVKKSNNTIVLTGQGTISNATLPPDTYYVIFSYQKTSRYKTPRTTIFYIYLGRTTEVAGNFTTGKTSIIYH
jgi:hypothetical protein